MANIDEKSELSPFERENLRPPYREYFEAKRHNFVANLEGFRALWDCCMLLDEIWTRECEDAKGGIPQTKAVALFLFINAHAKMRIALELGFSSCLPEAHSIVRDAVESVAHAHRLFVEPHLVAVWLRKGEDESSLKIWKEHFWLEKEDRLFDGLPGLFNVWKQYSEWGSHTNVGSLFHRFQVKETPTTIAWQLNYTGVPPEYLLPALLGLLHVFVKMEEVLYRDFESRLQLDAELQDMRRKFAQEKQAVTARVQNLLRMQRVNSASTG